MNSSPNSFPSLIAQHRAALGQEAVLAIDQQTHHLTLRDADTDGPHLCGQPRRRHLALMVRQQHEAARFRPEMAADARRQRRQRGLPVPNVSQRSRR